MLLMSLTLKTCDYMNDNEKESIKDLLRTVRIGLVILAVVGGYANRDLLIGVI